MQQDATTNETPDAGGGGALDLLSSSFLGAGFPTGIPSIKGGDAGPSNAISSASSGGSQITFSNPFSVAGQGGSASASATPKNTTSGNTNILLIGLAAFALVITLRK